MVRVAGVYVQEHGFSALACAMSVLAKSAVTFELFRQEVERLRKVAVVPFLPMPLDAGDVFNCRASRYGEDGEEPPHHRRRRSSSVDADCRWSARG